MLSGPEHLTGKKPEKGLPVTMMPQFYGRRLRNLVKKKISKSLSLIFLKKIKTAFLTLGRLGRLEAMELAGR